VLEDTPNAVQQVVNGGDNMQRTNRLKIACLERGMKMSDLAKQFDLTKSALSHYSSGRRQFPPDLLKQIADFLGCDPEALLPDEQAAASDEESTTLSVA
jgi:transcriptional regulator with XRE-family HTH domain